MAIRGQDDRIILIGLHTSATIAGPFIVIYMVHTLGASPAHIGLTSTGDALAALGGQALMATLLSRFNSKSLFGVSLAMNALVPLVWIGVDAPWQAAFPVILSGTAWGICHLAVFNLLLKYAPTEDIPDYVVVQQFAVLGAAFVGLLLGTLIIGQWGIVVLFLISAAGRVAAIPVLLAPVPRLTALRHHARRVVRGAPVAAVTRLLD